MPTKSQCIFSQLSKIEERSFQTEAFPMLSNSSLMQNEDFPLLISASLITVHKLCSIGTNDFLSVKMNEKNFRFFFFFHNLTKILKISELEITSTSQVSQSQSSLHSHKV